MATVGCLLAHPGWVAMGDGGSSRPSGSPGPAHMGGRSGVGLPGTCPSAGGLDSERGEEVEAARAALLDAHRSCVNHVLEQLPSLSPAGREKARGLLHDMAADAHLAYAGAGLGEAYRARLLQFRNAHPRAALDAFSPDLQRRVKAVRAIGGLKDPARLAEPVLFVALGDPSREIVFGAAFAAESGRYRSAALVDALLAALVRHDPAWRDVWDCWETTPTWSSVISVTRALAGIGSKRAAPTLLALMLRRAEPNSIRDAALAGALSASGEVRAIRHLMGLLSQVEVSFRSTEWGKVLPGKVTMARADAALMALIELTGQDWRDYGFKRLSPAAPLAWTGADYAFPGGEERAAAIAKFKGWWNHNSRSPRYKDLKPLQLPRIEKASGSPEGT